MVFVYTNQLSYMSLPTNCRICLDRPTTIFSLYQPTIVFVFTNQLPYLSLPTNYRFFCLYRPTIVFVFTNQLPYLSIPTNYRICLYQPTFVSVVTNQPPYLSSSTNYRICLYAPTTLFDFEHVPDKQRITRRTQLHCFNKARPMRYCKSMQYRRQSEKTCHSVNKRSKTVPQMAAVPQWQDSIMITVNKMVPSPA